ncbi:MAG TPA: malto-oligosyltrehalose trehalohydrolase [Polyangiaceae bacterium]|nr:malto-oligosyltrehalose trehalohydrolase [Polyangiaceae bacterium]
MTASRPFLGARFTGDGTRFGALTDAPRCAVRLYDDTERPLREVPLEPFGGGYFGADVPGVHPGALYRFVLGEQALPDPYARFLPRGVHGPAMVFESKHVWHSPRLARPAHAHVIYELHVGTFTPEGTYAGAAERLPLLAELGVTTLELMPLSSFAGERGWGYDGVAHFAPHAPYGTPDDLRAFVDRAHELGLSLLLDVVYNHFGPAGNYLPAYTRRYFTRESATAWGDAPDFGEPALRRYVLDNARYWLEEFRFDGLRLDATHAIVDRSPEHVLHELSRSLGNLEPKPLLIAEDERNAPELVVEQGLDAIWADDFHHQVHVTFTREREGYYAGYEPGAAELARAIREGWLYSGQRFAPTGKPRGAKADELEPEALVYCLQNHDQVGNRALGERLSTLVTPDAYRAALVLLLFLPATPLLFMGDEWGASTPFLYFTDHDAELGAQVRAGRRREFARFGAFASPEANERIPDPQAESTFAHSRLDWDERERGEHAETLALARAALALRSHDAVLCEPSRGRLRAEAVGETVVARRWFGQELRLLLMNCGEEARPLAEFAAYRELAGRRWLLGSEPAALTQELAPKSAVIWGGLASGTSDERSEHA